MAYNHQQFVKVTWRLSEIERNGSEENCFTRALNLLAAIMIKPKPHMMQKDSVEVCKHMRLSFMTTDVLVVPIKIPWCPNPRIMALDGFGLPKFMENHTYCSFYKVYPPLS